MPPRSELAAALRAWRDRVRPEEVGLPVGGRRRASGLRREELAALAGVSVDYLVRLEQGRAGNPSPQVLAALARALRLSSSERDVLYLAAGVAPPAPTVVPRHVGPGVQRILDRLVDTPVAVFTASWDQVLANPMWQALLGDHEQRTGRDANLIWRFFAHDRSRIARTAQDYTRFARTMVSDLHDAAARYPADRELAGLIRDLRAISDWFAELWDTYAVVRLISERKTIVSPTIGTVTLDCDVLTAPDSDLRIVVYTARPGSEAAAKLDLLRVTGLEVI
ncbi:MAG TPA: helix-turn-helix transcriptional regulator [Jatrophihabitantaceae bacterium]|jgi:transcriptional regulator with XRE-family HTH domain